MSSARLKQAQLEDFVLQTPASHLTLQSMLRAKAPFAELQFTSVSQ